MTESIPSPDPADVKPEYWAFISYRHLDNREDGRQWATWLHQYLETYDIPEDLVGKTNERGDVIPERLYPVFRDEEELPADADLARSVQMALDRSKYLIVICSPRAAQSRYVNEEIAYFKKIGKADRIIAVIIEGEPNVRWDEGKQAAGFLPEQECFPEALQHPVDQDGRFIVNEHSEPIAADFRLMPGGKQGWTNPNAFRQALQIQRPGLPSRNLSHEAKLYGERLQQGLLKIIAGAMGIPLSALTQRDKVYQLKAIQKRQRVLFRWMTALAVLALLAFAAGLFANQQRKLAEKQTEIATKERRTAQKQKARAETKAFHSKELANALKTALQTSGFELRDFPETLRLTYGESTRFLIPVSEGYEQFVLAGPLEADENALDVDVYIYDEKQRRIQESKNKGPYEILFVEPSKYSGSAQIYIHVSDAMIKDKECIIGFTIGRRSSTNPSE